ncbi:8-oxoguanine deaminase [Aestuariispira insulae]|uniref:8-oxoguanine deaminase n=1 Tax=Aestuariispira insulae TaxID=1461337 RepID=A0A3D9HMS5_9PROT|nr:8-oxoguanine deaminase [Aestuariispira insulae]RED50794.1 8-oxoguanine deaminase [Aestuariispira insulae]
MAIWIRNPLAILEEEARGGLLLMGDRIAELVPAGAEPTCLEPNEALEVFDASQHVVLPGLINTHHHFYQTLTRACPPALDKELFPWLKALYPIWAGLTPERMQLGSRLAMAELLLSGCTTTADHHYLFPKGMEEAIDIQVSEASQLGLRVLLTRGSMSLGEEDGGLPPQSTVQRDETILFDSERLISRYHEPGEGAMVQIALAPCSPFSVTTELMRQTARLARRHGVRLHTHLAETEDENEFCLKTFGMRPLDYLEHVGWMADDVWLAHGIHFNDEEIARLGKARVGITHCPSSNMVLASGICRNLELEAAGAIVGLGVDGSASNDGSNLIQEVRQALMIQRLRYGSGRVSHKDAFRWATAGSADCLGRRDLGRLEVGCQADLAMFKLDELRFSGNGDPLAALPLCGADRADRVMVQGRWRVIDGCIPGLDLEELLHSHQQAADELQAPFL